MALFLINHWIQDSSEQTADLTIDLEPQSAVQKLANEIELKRNENIIMFVGNHNVGKTTIIKNIINSYASTMDRNKFIRSRYDIELFTITESTDPSIPQYSSKAFKYLHLIHKYPQCYTVKNSQKQSIYKTAEDLLQKEEDIFFPSIQQRTVQQKHKAVNSKYDEMAVFGYIHQNGMDESFPFDIMEMILTFYAISKSMVRSYKFRVGNQVYNLWDINGDDFLCGNAAQLFQWIDHIIFIIDLSTFDQIDRRSPIHNLYNHYNGNMILYDIELFSAMMDDINVNYQRTKDKAPKVLVLMNKKDEFKRKVENMSDKEFKKYFCRGNNADINEGNKYLIALNFIKQRWLRRCYVKSDICGTHQNEVLLMFEFVCVL